MMRATIARRHMEGIVRVMQKPENRRKIWKSIFALLPRKQKSGFFLILLILAVSAARKANIAADIEQLEGGCQFVLAEGGPTSPAVSASASRCPASFSKTPAS